MDRKGISVGQFGGLALAFVVVAIIISVGADIEQQIVEGQCTWNTSTMDCVAGTTTTGSNVTSEAMDGLTTFGEWLPTVAVIIAAAVVIGVITNYM